MSQKTLTLEEIEDIAYLALVAAGTSDKNARSMAHATRAIEADGISSHGLAYIPIYAEHVRCGKVDGQAKPEVQDVAPALLRVNAANGFAHPAIDQGFDKLVSMAKSQGLAGMAVYNSYNCGVLGYHTHNLARHGLVGIGFTNAPASIAPSGGKTPVIGTNPFSIATPATSGKAEVLIDQSASAIAKSEVMKHAREGNPIPEGWALDADGKPTTDPEIGLKGSMAPSGGYKGVGVGLFVEIMAAALTGANLGISASPFSGTAGGPPGTGQFFIAINPNTSSDGQFDNQMSALIKAFLSQDGARLPGQNRATKRASAEENGVAVNTATLEKIERIIKEEKD